MNSSFCIQRLLATILFSVASAIALPAVRTQDPDLATEKTVDDVSIRYARKRLELAKTDLEVAISQNQRSPYVYSPLSLARLTDQVSQAELLLEYALQKEKPDPHAVHIGCLERSVELARKQFDWVSEVSKSLPELYHQDQVKRFQLNFELAKLALERANDPKVTDSPMDHFQWQIDQLQSDVLLLKLELERIRSGTK